MREFAASLDTPYRRLQRLETGARIDPALEHQVTVALDVLDSKIGT